MENNKTNVKEISPSAGGGDLKGATKFRVTPLNFATAFLLILAVYVWFYGIQVFGGNYPRILQKSGIFAGIFFLFAMVMSFLDIMLRNFFRETKKLWIVELSFITLTIIIFLLVK